MVNEKDGSGRILGVTPLLTFLEKMERRDARVEQIQEIVDRISDEDKEKIKEVLNNILKGDQR